MMYYKFVLRSYSKDGKSKTVYTSRRYLSISKCYKNAIRMRNNSMDAAWERDVEVRTFLEKVDKKAHQETYIRKDKHSKWVKGER